MNNYLDYVPLKGGGEEAAKCRILIRCWWKHPTAGNVTRIGRWNYAIVMSKRIQAIRRASSDAFAHLGRLDEAMADCAFVPDDHRAPAFYGLPGGTKRQFIDQIRLRALTARGARR